MNLNVMNARISLMSYAQSAPLPLDVPNVDQQSLKDKFLLLVLVRKAVAALPAEQNVVHAIVTIVIVAIKKGLTPFFNISLLYIRCIIGLLFLTFLK